MANVTLPVTSRLDTDANLASDFIGNDQAIIAQVNGNLENANVSASANISRSKLATATVDDISSIAAAAAGLNQTGTVHRGSSIVATEETRLSTSYGTLTTPDQVSSVVLPSNSLMVIAYQALFKSSAAGSGQAALFLGANQLKARNGAATPGLVSLQEASTTSTGYRSLGTYAGGLLASSISSASDDASDVTTGQAVNVSGGTGLALAGGICAVFAAAGTYTVTVQFKASSGTVTAKERKLWVWIVGF